MEIGYNLAGTIIFCTAVLVILVAIVIAPAVVSSQNQLCWLKVDANATIDLNMPMLKNIELKHVEIQVPCSRFG